MPIIYDEPSNSAMPCQPLPPFRRPRTVKGRRRPKVLVLDTGLSTLRSGAGPAHPYLADAVVIQPDWRDRLRPMATDDEDEPDADGDRRLDLQSGHGTFIVGIIRRLCPEAEIHVNGVLSGLATSDDATIGHGIKRAASRIGPHGPDVVVMSLGAYTDDDQPPPLAAWIEKYLGDSVVVAAAGNSASKRPVFPAALPGVVAVGALDSRGRAPFSNHGGWVDACAPAVDVVSTFFTHFDEMVNGTSRCFRGWARWSGTSFAAPKVAAAIAHDMYLHGGSARAAWTRLSAETRFRHPDLGVVFNIV
jgi:subtilisin family serine protease